MGAGYVTGSDRCEIWECQERVLSFLRAFFGSVF